MIFIDRTGKPCPKCKSPKERAWENGNVFCLNCEYQKEKHGKATF